MVKRKNIFFTTLLTLLCVSCETYDFGGMIAADSSVQERFANSIGADRESHASQIINTEDYCRFVVATDLHLRGESWDLLSGFLTDAADRAPFGVLLGDFMYEKGASLGRLADSLRAHEEFSVVTAIGNHDVYKRGYQSTYRDTFGATCYRFTVRTGNVSDLFVVLDSANGTLGADQFRWLEVLLGEERASARYCFIFTHANFFNPPGHFDVISTYAIEEQMKLQDLFARHRVTAVFTGHSHVRDQTTVRGVRYVTVGAWCNHDGEYCLVECKPDGEPTLNFYTSEPRH